MLVCLDVDYRATAAGERAVAAAVVVTDPRSDVAAHEITVAVDHIAAYVPGAFFERELPCLLAVLDAVVVVLGTAAFTIVVDAHVWLGDHPGLGQRLYQAWRSRHVDKGSADVVVGGVGKTAWHDTSAHRAVVRGEAKALWVSSAGLDVDVAAALIESMHGPYRLPTLLKRVDRLCRDTPLIDREPP